jgi:heterodisulfide reductase subunit A
MEDLHVDALVVGGGIAGMQAALDLADQGYQVALVERQASIGGTMIALSKVFPTLDCCSCITTPKMSAVAHHDNIDLLTWTDVNHIGRNGHGYVAEVTRKPRYIDEALCTGCRQCEFACPVEFANPFDINLGATRGINIPFSTAVPQIPVLDIDNCLVCGKCLTVCPADAIDFLQQPEPVVIYATAVILATGFKLTPVAAKTEYGGGKLPNVIDALVMERLLAPTGPYGHVIRPSDGKEPESIAYVQCAGSRDKTLGVPYCSRICCMYAIKQAMLLSGALPLADITIYYMDIRTFGKGYEQFYRTAEAMGVEFVKGKVATIHEDADHNPTVRLEMVEAQGQLVERSHDLVVLSVGMVPKYDPRLIYDVDISADGFVTQPHANISPCETTRPGVFVAGTAAGPMDIVDSIVMAGAAAAEAAAWIEAHAVRPALRVREVAYV